jgi:hypothetical protein
MAFENKFDSMFSRPAGGGGPTVSVPCARCGKYYQEFQINVSESLLTASAFVKSFPLTNNERFYLSKLKCPNCRDEIRARRFLTNKCNLCYVKCSGEAFSLLPDGTKVVLCAECSRDLFPIYKAHYDKGISLIAEGRDDLERAKGFDPESDYIKTNLSQARELSTKLNLTKSRGSEKKTLSIGVLKHASQRTFFHTATVFWLFVLGSSPTWLLALSFFFNDVEMGLRSLRLNVWDLGGFGTAAVALSLFISFYYGIIAFENFRAPFGGLLSSLGVKWRNRTFAQRMVECIIYLTNFCLIMALLKGM